jgi:flagellar biosynthesis/type III secretory pathway protein FliH
MSPKATRHSSAARAASGIQATPYPWKGGAPTADRRPASADTSADTAVVDARSAERFAALEREAFVKGYAQGERSGAEAAARQGDAMLRRLSETIEEVAALRADLLRRSERDLVRVALVIAERVLHREVSLDRELILAMAHIAIDRLGNRASATIRLHPADHAALMAVPRTQPFTGAVEIVADPSVSRGGCLVQSDFGLIDLGVEAQLKEVSRAMLGDDTAEDATASASQTTPVPVKVVSE